MTKSSLDISLCFIMCCCKTTYQANHPSRFMETMSLHYHVITLSCNVISHVYGTCLLLHCCYTSYQVVWLALLGQLYSREQSTKIWTDEARRKMTYIIKHQDWGHKNNILHMIMMMPLTNRNLPKFISHFNHIDHTQITIKRLIVFESHNFESHTLK